MKEKIRKGNTKYIIVAIVIVLLVFSIGAIFVTSLDSIFSNLDINQIDAMITDKYVNTNDTNHYYVIVDDNGEVFDIINVSDQQEIFNNIEVGKKYHLIVQGPPGEKDKYIHIIQVYNGTN